MRGRPAIAQPILAPIPKLLFTPVCAQGGSKWTQPQKTTFPLEYFTETPAIDRVHQHNPLREEVHEKVNFFNKGAMIIKFRKDER